MNKKKNNPRTEFLILRVTKVEREQLKNEAKWSKVNLSVYLRALMNLKEEND